ncbi:MAG: trypsin-like peptidase domain-containing protein [Eubacteriales bacterium]|nr:trypsin-like peptidase domain-containing protein [Eubacteriales bacterium]
MDYEQENMQDQQPDQQLGQQPDPQPQKRPKRRSQAGKIIAVTALAVAFVAFCCLVSFSAVQSVRLAGQLGPNSEQAVTAEQAEEKSPAEKESPAENGAQGQADGAGADGAGQESLPETDGQGAASRSGQIASAGTVQPAADGTAVVTDVTDVVTAVMPACVSITNNFTEQVQDFWGQTYSQEESASGSGIIIGENDQELLIVTNNHVVDGTKQLYVQFIDGSNVEAQIKGTDAAVDLAVVAVKLADIADATKDAICVAQMGDSDSLQIGEPAIAIGNALGYGQSVTTGVISALNRTPEKSEDGNSTALIQTDAAINPGNSGGALLNIKGQVIGINSNKIGGSAIEGMGYAIPISTARPIIEELMTYETKDRVSDEERGYLGISCINVTSDLSQNFNMPEGIFVAQVYEGTGAARAGLVRGDIVTAFEGTKVTNQEELTDQMRYYKAGETVEITIMQGSPNGYQAKNVTVTLSSYDELSKASQSSQQEQSGQNGRSQSGLQLWP